MLLILYIPGIVHVKEIYQSQQMQFQSPQPQQTQQMQQFQHYPQLPGQPQHSQQAQQMQQFQQQYPQHPNQRLSQSQLMQFPQSNNQIQIISTSPSCCCCSGTFDFTYLKQDPRISTLNLSTECLTTFNSKYKAHVAKTRTSSWGCVILFIIVAMVLIEIFDFNARISRIQIPGHYKCKPGVEISPLAAHPGNTTDLWCCNKVLNRASTVSQVRAAACTPMGGEEIVDVGTVDTWKLTSVAIACKEQENMGLSNGCNCIEDTTNKIKCTGYLFALESSSTRIQYYEAREMYSTIGETVFTFIMVVMYLGPLTMSFVIPCRNKRALNRLVDKCFLSWKQQCGTSIISLEKKGCCGGTWIESNAKLTLQFPYMQAQQQQGIIQNGSVNYRSGSVTSVQIAPLSSPSPAQNSNALNSPGKWDVFISHTQRNPEGKLMGLDLHNTLATMGKSSWLDVKMDNMSMDAMREGIQNSSCVIAVITDSCVTADDDPNKGGPEQNMYFNRWMCIQELKWAIEAGVPIQPVIRAEDKKKIGNFIQMAPDELKFLGGVDWKHLDRSNKRYFKLGVEMTLEGVKDLLTQKRLREEMLVVASEDNGGGSGETKGSAGEQKV